MHASPIRPFLRLSLPCVALLVGSACEFANGGNPDGTGRPGGSTTSCPTGMQRATTASASFNDVRIDAFGTIFFFDNTATYDGQPAACINAAGTETELVITDGAGAVGTLSVFAAAADDYDLVNSAGASVRINWDAGSYANDPLVVGDADWIDGLVTVESVGPVFSFNLIAAFAEVADGTTVLLDGAFDVTQ